MIGTAPAAAGALSNAPRIARTRLEENAEKPVVGDNSDSSRAPARTRRALRGSWPRTGIRPR